MPLSTKYIAQQFRLSSLILRKDGLDAVSRVLKEYVSFTPILHFSVFQPALPHLHHVHSTLLSGHPSERESMQQAALDVLIRGAQAYLERSGGM